MIWGENMRIHYFFVGGCKISSDRVNAEAIINICMKCGIFYRNLMFNDDGASVQLTCSLYASRILRDACRNNGIDICIKESYGIPHILKKYNKRYGILLGMIVALAIIWLSRQYIWDVRVSGVDIIDENMVIDCLKDKGLFVGSRTRDLDIDAIENKVLIDFDEISWLAVNLKGSVAYVEVREKLILQEDNVEGHSPANIIAKCDGQIEAVEARSGEPCVVLGQYVNKGDLLISGIYDSVPLGYRYIRAKGDVWAKTVRTLSVEIPLEYYEKVYIGERVVENSIIFFSKPIKLFENTGFLGTTYDTIYKISNLSLSGGIDLPITSKKTVHMYYEYQNKIRTAEDASALAFDELDTLIANILKDGAEVLRKNITYDIGDSCVRLECTLVLKENIAETMEFKVDR